MHGLASGVEAGRLETSYTSCLSTGSTYGRISKETSPSCNLQLLSYDPIDGAVADVVQPYTRSQP